MDLEEITSLLFSSKKLDRDRGVAQLVEYVQLADAEQVHIIEDKLSEVLEDPETTWESKHGSLSGMKALILQMRGKPIDFTSRNFLEKICSFCLGLLENSEVRIRLGAGAVLGSLCALEGPQVYEKCSSRVLELIRTNLERESESSSVDAADIFEDPPNSRELMQTQRRRRLSSGSSASQIFHDTAGWKCLETSMKCLQYIIDGCGESFKSFIQKDLLELLFLTLSHTNRFVRETGYYVIGSLVNCAVLCDETAYNPFTVEHFGHEIAKQIGVGLGDNWSQVRLAASESARNFILSFKTDEEREVFFPELLPKMCLNRYYIADGVRIYSQESWRRVAKDKGRELVKKYINYFVDYYILQTKADNHAVREAACACIAELASKIDQVAMKPHVPRLLQTLVDCFGDDSWPVRDAACLACGNFILCYPNESRCVMDVLYPLFFTNLKDCIPSVRQGAAGSLANVVKAYGNEAYNVLEEQIKEGLTGVENQPSESEKYGQMDKGPAIFSVVKKLRDNDMELHTDKQMYSCGSLAPKMGRGGGCSDHKFRKPSEPWEFADGCIHLIAELCQVEEVVPKVVELLPLVVQATNVRHYTHHVCLLESLCKQLPNIGKGLNKRRFKQYLEIFLEAIFYSLTCENILTSSAASQCLTQLSTFLGPNIFRSRIEMANPSYLQLLDANLKGASSF